MSHTILIVDDEPEIIEMLQLFLERESYTIVAANDGQEALQRLQEHTIDLAIVDIMMPRMDGLQLLTELRLTNKLPVILLSAKSEDSDKIVGLGLGADDFVAKPFNPLIVLARVQAQLRRTYTFNEEEALPSMPPTRVGELTLDHDSCSLLKRGQLISLSAIEYKLLHMLMSAPGRVFTKKQIFEQVWGEHYMADDNTIMVQMSRLRDKVEDTPRNPLYIKTVRGLGYRFAKRDELHA
ncbi:response regulator transcription factor [Paenibacillus sp. SC116]|uniref:response regulator transcription factor n=1 Tax=Paenibacillus sp. SC116 TaxID=2968986 RepID=UPI00215B6FE5|nr:response regulator transcription factor [Paenibacillus sp. SC116]MCR8844630.1 response regulator transcription factor [Paenibacillus sp. SC116]